MNRKSFRIHFTLLAAASLFAAVLPDVWQVRLKGCVLSYTAPAQKTASHVRAGLLGLGGIFGKVFSPANAPGQMERAREEIARLRELLIIERGKTIEKEKMIAGLAAFERFSRDHYGEKLEVIPARIIGGDTTSLAAIAIIDKGTADGVRRGAGVVWGHAAVGVVTVAEKKASLVNLLSNPACRVPAYIQRTGESTMVSGSAADALRMHHVFRDAVKPGDICLTSGELRMFPRDIIIGAVTEARLPPGEMFQEISVRPMLNLSALQTVIVLVRDKMEFSMTREE